MTTATRGELCEAFGISSQALHKLTESGTVVRVGKDTYDWVASVKAYTASLRRHAQTPDLTAARTSLAENKSAIAAIERRKAEGSVVDVAEVERDWSSRILRTRARFLGMPSKLASRVVGLKPAEAAVVMRQEIYEILTELGRSEPDEQGADAA